MEAPKVPPTDPLKTDSRLFTSAGFRGKEFIQACKVFFEHLHFGVIAGKPQIAVLPVVILHHEEERHKQTDLEGCRGEVFLKQFVDMAYEHRNLGGSNSRQIFLGAPEPEIHFVLCDRFLQHLQFGEDGVEFARLPQPRKLTLFRSTPSTDHRHIA